MLRLSRRLLRNSGLFQSVSISVGMDYRLADPESLAAMPGACNKEGV